VQSPVETSCKQLVYNTAYNWSLQCFALVTWGPKKRKMGGLIYVPEVAVQNATPSHDFVDILHSHLQNIYKASHFSLFWTPSHECKAL
jgi:hypothetical protein